MSTQRFDAAYYERFYFEPATRVAEPAYFDRLAGFVTAYLDLLGCRVSTVLDAGCGAGLLHPGLRRAWPAVEVHAIDASEWACKRYGWQHDTIESFQPPHDYDLVICQDVLQYLDRNAADAALRKLMALARVALFFGVLTQEDWRDNCDQERTDDVAHLRSARWYAKRLRQEFHNAGGGLYIRRDTDVVLYALDHV